MGNALRIAADVKRRIWMLGLVIAAAMLAGCGGGADETKTPPAAVTDPGPASPGETTRPSAAPAPTGTAVVSGTVFFEGQAPARRRLRMDADPGCAKKHTEPVLSEALVLGEHNALANVLVKLTDGLAEGSHALPTEQAVLNQLGCRYEPHVLALRVGQPLLIKNSDGLLHNVHSLSKENRPFNRAMPAAVREAEYTFDQEELFKVKCDVHPWMNSWVAVVSHPYFTVTGEDGTFTISGLPAGTYGVEAWHERLGTQSASITLDDGQRGTLDLTFTR